MVSEKRCRAVYRRKELLAKSKVPSHAISFQRDCVSNTHANLIMTSTAFSSEEVNNHYATALITYKPLSQTRPAVLTPFPERL